MCRPLCLCIYMLFLCFFFGYFPCFIVLTDSELFAVMYITLFYHYSLGVCFLRKEERVGSGWDVRSGGTMSGRRRETIHKIYCIKYLFSIKRKKRKWI